MKENSALENLNWDALKTREAKILVSILMIVVGLYGLSTGFPGAVDENGESAEDRFNRADIMFMGMMIIHHDQAIEMAELAEGRTDNENILELAENISAAQRRENELMASWLKELGYDRPTNGHRMAGMASRQEMLELKNSSGREFDLLFSKLMIRHHEGGIQMARSFNQRGSADKLLELEREMIEAQTREIQMMQEWRSKWS